MIDLICICCPEGCRLQVDPDHDYAVTGNRCPRGETYGREEVISPVRIVTSTVRLTSEAVPRLPVKTDRPVPKSVMFQVMDEINRVVLNPPVRLGQPVISDVAGTGADVVATRTVTA